MKQELNQKNKTMLPLCILDNNLLNVVLNFYEYFTLDVAMWIFPGLTFIGDFFFCVSDFGK